MKVLRKHYIKASANEVWQVITPVERLPEWFSGVESASHVGGPAKGVGRRQQVKRYLYGHAVEIEQEVYLWEANRSLGLRHVRESIQGRDVLGVRDFSTTLTLQPDDYGTMVSLEYRWKAPLGIAWLQSLVGGRVMGKEIKETLKKIADRVNPPPRETLPTIEATDIGSDSE